MQIDLVAKRDVFIKVLTELFIHIINLDNRTDEKKREGVQCVILAPNTRNLVNISIGNPSDAARFFAVEKAVRSNILGDAASQNSEDPEAMKFAGSLTDKKSGLQISTSGLKAEEDVVVSLLLLSEILGEKPIEIRKRIEAGGGKLPECFKDETNYLYPLVN